MRPCDANDLAPEILVTPDTVVMQIQKVYQLHLRISQPRTFDRLEPRPGLGAVNA
jgi:hypothetical protein